VTSRRIRGSTQDDVRRHNLGTILTEVHRHGHRSRAVLTAEMGLNRSTIGDLVAELAEAGLVVERSSRARGRAGRPSLEVAPCPDGPYVLAVDLGVRHLGVARVGLGGELLDRVDVDSGRDWSDLDITVDAIASTCARLRESAPPTARCVGVGLSVPGVVRQADGLLRFAPNLGWIDLPLGARLGERLDLPAVIANDADLGALAEHWRGVAVGHDHVVVVSGEIGIGGGILVGGRPLRGRGGYAGEIGHLRVNPDGRPCRCGSRGCLETEIGVDALLSAAGQPAGSGVGPYRDILARVAAGDPEATGAAESVARWLGVGVGVLVNVFNPDIVVLGGPLGELFAVTEHIVADMSAQCSLVAPREQVRLAASALGPDAQIVGAAELAFEPLLQDPIGALTRLAA
jgi:predicted NBD/HSP70 family sugar kinase